MKDTQKSKTIRINRLKTLIKIIPSLFAKDYSNPNSKIMREC